MASSRDSSEELKFLHVTLKDVFCITAKMAEEILENKISVDAIVGISRGGLLPARLLSDFLGISQLEIVRAEFYVAPGETAEKPVITRSASKSVKGKSILVVDDVADSGETFIEVVKHLKDLGASRVISSALYVKPWNKAPIDLHIGESDAWIIFPWERVETVEKMIEKHGDRAYELCAIPQDTLKTIRKIIEMKGRCTGKSNH